MKNNTAIQELIDWITEIENSVASLTFEEKDFMLLRQFKEKLISKIEKEKSNLIDFHIEVMKIGLITEGEKKWSESYLPVIKEIAEKHYNKLFKLKLDVSSHLYCHCNKLIKSCSDNSKCRKCKKVIL